MKHAFKILLSFVLVALIIGQSQMLYAAGDEELLNKVAFLHGQDVWLANADGSGRTPYTHTGGKVLDFLFSPSLRYFAYFYITGYTDDWGEYEEGEAIPQIPVYSLIIKDLRTNRILQNIPAPGEIHIANWLPDNRMVLYTASGGGMGDLEVYDPHTNIVRQMDYETWERFYGADFAPDGTEMIYTDSDNEDGLLHRLDLRTQKETVISVKQKIFGFKIANHKTHIAWADRTHEKGGIWVRNLKTNAMQSWKADIHDWYNIFLRWSFGDRYLMAFTMGEAIIIDTQKPNAMRKLDGYNFIWLPRDKILIEQGGQYPDLFLYDVVTGKRTLFAKNSSYAQCCGRGEKVFTHN